MTLAWRSPRLGFVDSEVDGTLMRLDLYGSFIGRQRLGVYASVPLTWLSDNGHSDSSLGGLDIDSLFVTRSGPYTLILRGGLVRSLASDDDALVNLTGAFVRWGAQVGIKDDSSKARWAGGG